MRGSHLNARISSEYYGIANSNLGEAGCPVAEHEAQADYNAEAVAQWLLPVVCAYTEAGAPFDNDAVHGYFQRAAQARNAGIKPPHRHGHRSPHPPDCSLRLAGDG